ncbi:MAG: Smr/MutS family protein [Thermoanaerobaculales bacterium]|nr:Smr/MutS family protein [Thermoanaerobaculales bacterium]
MAGSISPRTAYLLTKLAAFAVAAVLTVPLARVVGPKAWWGLAAFGAVLAVLAVVVVAAFGRGAPTAGPRTGVDTDADPEPADEPPVEIPVEDAIDLHPFAPRDIPDVVADYLGAAHAAGFREVRLIHGRGLGVQRERVRKVLTRHPLVVSIHDATPDRGGWGATIAYLSRGDRVE